MKKIEVWLKLLRVKHYVKNLLVFIPLFFSGNFGKNVGELCDLLIAFIAFCCLSSVVYIINDIKDREGDRLHAIKCKRPIASGDIKVTSAVVMAVALSIAILILNSVAVGNMINEELLFLGFYLVLNVAYSMGLKSVPIVDIMILASGFLLRILYGAEISNQPASNWLVLTVIAFSLYMGLGKRRNEILKQKECTQTRSVLQFYTFTFLDKMMNACMTLGIVFYSLWAISMSYSNLSIWTVPLVIFICMKYSLIIEGDSYGDPVDVLLSDKVLMIGGLFYIIYMCFAIYVTS